MLAPAERSGDAAFARQGAKMKILSALQNNIALRSSLGLKLSISELWEINNL